MQDSVPLGTLESMQTCGAPYTSLAASGKRGFSLESKMDQTEAVTARLGKHHRSS